MPSISERKQSNSEFNGSFNDTLNVLVKSTFDPSDVLLFITYQPDELILDPNIVKEHTSRLLQGVRYVEVIEQTFKNSNRYNNGGYVDGYHSHILMREADYDAIKSQLNGYDIVKKRVYDREGLINRYLSKQAGLTNNRLLPTRHFPKLIMERLEAKPIKKVYSFFIKPTKIVFRIHFSEMLVRRFIRMNKRLRSLRYNDDT